MGREQTNGSKSRDTRVAPSRPYRAMAKTIQVSSVKPTIIEKGYLPIIANTRATKGKTIEPANKLRAIVIPEWNVSDLPSKWAMFALAQLEKTATAQLAAQWEQNGNQWNETDAELYTVDGLLMFAARAAESKRLNAENIKAESADFVLTLQESSRELATKILCSMSAPAKSGTEKQLASLAEKLATYIETLPEDAPESRELILSTVHRKMLERFNELKAQREAYETDNAAF